MVYLESLTMIDGTEIDGVAIRVNSVQVRRAMMVADTKFECEANIEFFRYDKENEQLGEYIQIPFYSLQFPYDGAEDGNIIKLAYLEVVKLPAFTDGVEI